MPELPEVEVIKLGLEKKLPGKTLKGVEIRSPKSFQGEKKQLLNKKVTAVLRVGKMLQIALENNLNLLFHLKMSGQLILIQGKQRVVGGHPTRDMLGDLPNNSTRVIFEFSEAKLFFNDQRKFGWVKVVDNDFMQKQQQKLGPEPLEKTFTWQRLKEQLIKRKNTPIKVALLDQTLVAGIGNIYASEALFLAKIHPQRKVNTLDDEDFQNLKKGIVRSLEISIKYGGSTRSHFVSSEGQKGSFLEFANVYERKGQPCQTCQAPIKKITLGGRGTYYCPKCQA